MGIRMIDPSPQTDSFQLYSSREREFSTTVRLAGLLLKTFRTLTLRVLKPPSSHITTRYAPSLGTVMFLGKTTHLLAITTQHTRPKSAVTMEANLMKY